MADDPEAARVATLAPVPGVKPPSELALNSNVLANWKLFKQKWSNYFIISKLGWHPREYQVAVLLNTLGDTALRVYNGLQFDTAEDERTTAEIVAAFDLFCVGEVNETYERYMFNKRVQGEDETFENFNSAISDMIKTCNYCADCRDSILRDRIVIGIREDETQRLLLKEQNLTLQAAINICKSSEKAAHRGRVLRPEATVNKVGDRRAQGREL